MRLLSSTFAAIFRTVVFVLTEVRFDGMCNQLHDVIWQRTIFVRYQSSPNRLSHEGHAGVESSIKRFDLLEKLDLSQDGVERTTITLLSNHYTRSVSPISRPFRCAAPHASFEAISGVSSEVRHAGYFDFCGTSGTRRCESYLPPV